ncbi:g6188 [Coccomyxa viridis]|uniref:G6188 protein n=1 Tax=Coccomyxa viridis TaxID=1274662 RepID=A0ABP1FUR9_9CHLO
MTADMPMPILAVQDEFHSSCVGRTSTRRRKQGDGENREQDGADSSLTGALLPCQTSRLTLQDSWDAFLAGQGIFACDQKLQQRGCTAMILSPDIRGRDLASKSQLGRLTDGAITAGHRVRPPQVAHSGDGQQGHPSWHAVRAVRWASSAG